MSAASAFAFRKATRTVASRLEITDDTPQVNGQDDQDDTSSLQPQRKKRRKSKKAAEKVSLEAPPITDLPALSLKSQVSEGYSPNGKEHDGSEAAQDIFLTESDNENEEAASLDGIESISLIDQQLCTFLPTSKNVLGNTKKEWSVRLGRKDTLAVVGQYDLWVRKGAISISGAIIHASSKLHRVYAPSTHSLPVIRPVYDPYGSEGQIVEISILSSTTGIRLLRKLSPSFGRIWNGHAGEGYRRSFTFLHMSSDDAHQRPLKPIDVPTDWQSRIQRLTTKSGSVKILLCGPKNSGKSSLCRLIANAFLSSQRSPQSSSSVYFLDLDPGQPEFTCSGEVSLIKLHDLNLSVSFTHPRITSSNSGNRVIRSHYVGYLSPREDPNQYINYCTNLLNIYKTHTHSLNSAHTLLINTPGWIQGTGLSLLSSLLSLSHPTTTIFTSLSGPDDATSALSAQIKAQRSEFIQVSSQPYPEATKTASTLRAMQSQSYFHLSPSSEVDGNLRWDSRPLSEMTPLVVPFTGEKQGIFAIHILGDPQNPDFYASIIFGSTVGIVVLDNDYHQNLTVQRTKDGLPYLPSRNNLDPRHSSCMGQAYIRSISKTSFHLITPIPSAKLHDLWKEGAKIVLVKGGVDTPVWAYKQDIELEKSELARSVARGETEVENAQVGQDGMEKGLEEQEEEEEEEGEGEARLRRMVERTPFLQVVERGATTAKARKIRRDLRYKPVGDG